MDFCSILLCSTIDVSSDSVVLRCPALNRLPPEIEGIAVVNGEWRLAVASHRGLLTDLTGIDPTGDLDLQALATMTARLEGYVNSKKQARGSAGVRTESRAEGDGGGILSWLRSLLTTCLPDSLVDVSGPTPEPQVTANRYDVDRVYQLSRFFRAKLEAHRDGITRETERRPEPVPAE